MVNPDDRDLWTDSVVNVLVPKMMASVVVMATVPETATDAKFAVELGVAIMLDKPIIALVAPGSHVSAKLVRVADRIIEVDMSAPPDDAVARRIAEAVHDLTDGR